MAALISGGKDSWTAFQMGREAGHDVVVAVNMRSPNSWSYMYHTVNSWVVEVQAMAAGVPLEVFYTRGVKEEEVDDLAYYLSQVKKRWGIEGLSIGGIRSRYQGDRIGRVCEQLGLELYAPLWHKDSEWLLREYLRRNMKVIFVLASALGIGPNWLGRQLDEKAIEELMVLNKKWGVDPTGEGGEYESLVLDAPFFRKSIRVEEAEKVWRVDTGTYVIKRVRLVPKSPMA
ncbi:MAG: diphthine--ammonia ligase [Thermoprotei archaeon]|nr:diphthine--ammonia ligase [TACK group archaeon]